MICLLSYFDENYKSLGEISSKAIEKYAKKFGYDSFIYKKRIAIDRPSSWHKIKLIEDAFQKGYEYVFWIDADALIVDCSVNIRDEIEKTKYLYLVAHPMDKKLVPNLGIFFIKNCSWSKALLQKMWNKKAYINHKWWENAAFIELLGINSLLSDQPDSINSKYLKHIKWLDLSWNNLPLYAPSRYPIINHYSAIPYKERLIHMRNDFSGLPI